MEFNELTEEQKAKARACKSPEELLALAKEEGIELTDEELETVAGGKAGWKCPSDCWEDCEIVGPCYILSN